MRLKIMKAVYKRKTEEEEKEKLTAACLPSGRAEERTFGKDPYF
jgi:hypothetical protein